MKRLFAALALMLAVVPAYAAGEVFEEGIDYEPVNQAWDTHSDGKVQVTEFFWYGCPHCYAFEPHVQHWLQSKPEDVEFVRVPAIRDSALWKLHATAFYTAELLDVGEKMHAAIFKAIHEDHQRLDSIEAIRALFVANGIEAADFDKVVGSFALRTRLNRAAQLWRRSGGTGVPTVVVNGENRVVASGSYQRMLETIDFLIEQARNGTTH